MKILHIASGDLWAGAEVQLYTLSVELMKNGIELHIVLLNSGELQKRLEDQNIVVTVIEEENHGFIKTLFSLRKLIHAERPDIIHTHRLKENILGVLANLISIRCKSVRTVHGAPEFSNNIKRKILVMLDSFCGRHFQQGIIAVTQELKQELSFIFPSGRIHTIYNGVDFESISSSTKSDIAKLYSSDCWHIGIAGRLEPVKRLDIFLDIAELFKLDDGHQVQFHIFGDGSLRNTLENSVQSKNISDRVQFHGHINNLANHLPSLNLLIMCSDHEGTPMVALESIAATTPVLAHAVGGLKEMLGMEGQHFLIADNRAENYCHCISAILRGSLVKEFEQLRMKVMAKYSSKNNAALTIQLYQGLCR